MIRAVFTLFSISHFRAGIAQFTYLYITQKVHLSRVLLPGSTSVSRLSFCFVVHHARQVQVFITTALNAKANPDFLSSCIHVPRDNSMFAFLDFHASPCICFRSMSTDQLCGVFVVVRVVEIADITVDADNVNNL